MVSPIEAKPIPAFRKEINDRFEVRFSPGQRLKADSLALENLEFIGSGGNGSVFRMLISEGPLCGLIVAVKFLETIGQEERVKRFEQEVGILKDVNHPHVIKVLDIGRYTIAQRIIPFFVMEYQPRNLQREASSHPRGIHPDAVLPLCLQMTSALVHIHAKNVAHRDLKPANILFDGSNIKIADFGIASLLDRSALVNSAKGKKIGPHFFMSPEQWKWWKAESDQAPGEKSDIFQLGLIFMTLLTGYNPNTIHQWKEGIGERVEPKTKMRVYEGSLVNGVAGIVGQMIEISPDKRPDALQVQERLINTFRQYSSHFCSAPH
jgi:serine/threonine-protein kinase